MSKLSTTILLTNGATPYRTPVLNEVARAVPEFVVVYDTLIEKGRQWDPGRIQHKALYWNINSVPEIARMLLARRVVLIVTHLDPRSVVISAAVKSSGGKIVYFSDSSLVSEDALGPIRRSVHKRVVPRFDAYIAGTPNTREYLVSRFGLRSESIFSSYLAPLPVFRRPRGVRRYDILMGGRDIPLKRNDFSVAVCAEVARATRRPLTIGVFGEFGRVTSTDTLSAIGGVRVEKLGELDPSRLSDLFAEAQVLLFPSEREAWGLIAHEALAAGCAVVASPGVTSGRYLQKIYEGMFVVDVDLDKWVSLTARLLAIQDVVSLRETDQYTLDAAAAGIVEAIRRVGGSACAHS